MSFMPKSDRALFLGNVTITCVSSVSSAPAGCLCVPERLARSWWLPKEGAGRRLNSLGKQVQHMGAGRALSQTHEPVSLEEVILAAAVPLCRIRSRRQALDLPTLSVQARVRAIAEIVAALVKSTGDGQDINLNHIKTEVRVTFQHRPARTCRRTLQPAVRRAGSPQAWSCQAAKAS